MTADIGLGWATLLSAVGAALVTGIFGLVVVTLTRRENRKTRSELGEKVDIAHSDLQEKVDCANAELQNNGGGSLKDMTEATRNELRSVRASLDRVAVKQMATSQAVGFIRANQEGLRERVEVLHDIVLRRLGGDEGDGGGPTL